MLGQNGFIFKTPEGTLLSIDLYLTNSVPELLPDLPVDLQRMLPIYIAPEELETVYACTHSHFDHADPQTIQNLRDKETSVHRAIVDLPRLPVVWSGGRENCIHRTAGRGFLSRCKIEGTFALPTDDSDLNHVGFLLTFFDRLKVYVTGDTDHSELLASVAKHSPQVLITCINGNYNNLSHWEAAELAKWVNPKIAIPCHFDMFRDNAIDPLQFRASLKMRAPKVEYYPLPHAEARLLT